MQTEDTMRRHEHSGNAGSAWLLVPPTAIVGAIILAVMYSYLVVYSPIVGLISVIAVLALAGFLGSAIGRAGKAARCRKPGLLGAWGLLAGLLAFYVSWTIFLYLLISRSVEDSEVTLLGLALSPVVMWELGASLATEGWYSIRGFTPSGWFLWAIWGIEAVVIILGTMAVAGSSLDDDVFCERCSSWCDYNESFARWAVPETGEELVAMAQGNEEALLAALPMPAAAPGCVSVDTWKCQGCLQTAALRLKGKKRSFEKGEMKEDDGKELSPVLVVTAHLIDRLPGRETPAEVLEVAPVASG